MSLPPGSQLRGARQDARAGASRGLCQPRSAASGVCTAPPLSQPLGVKSGLHAGPLPWVPMGPAYQSPRADRNRVVQRRVASCGGAGGDQGGLADAAAGGRRGRDARRRSAGEVLPRGGLTSHRRACERHGVVRRDGDGGEVCFAVTVGRGGIEGVELCAGVQ